MKTCILIGLSLALSGLIGARAQRLGDVLHIGVRHPILDEYGHVLQGGPGRPADACDAVQILWTEGTLYPPDETGAPHPDNPVVAQVGIGHLMTPAIEEPGMFAVALVDRPPSGMLFVRVFNHARPDQASFYADSEPFSAAGPSVFLDIDATCRPIDSADSDEDGLINAWERSLGCEVGDPDTDGDGLSDRQEQLSGTNPLEPWSGLFIEALPALQGPTMVIRWQSVVGQAYRIRHSPDRLLAPEAFEVVGAPLLATGELSEAAIDLPPEDAAGFFCVEWTP